MLHLKPSLIKKYLLQKKMLRTAQSIIIAIHVPKTPRARYFPKIKPKIIRQNHKFAYIAIAILNFLILFSLPFIMWIYHFSEETTKLAEQILIMHGIMAMLIWPLSFTLPSTLRAANDVKFTMEEFLCLQLYY